MAAAAGTVIGKVNYEKRYKTIQNDKNTGDLPEKVKKRVKIMQKRQ